MQKILKIIFILAFGAVCLVTASHFAEKYAAEAAFKEQTLAEAVMQSRLEAELKRAEEQAKQELEEQGRELVTEVMETKPPVTTLPETTTTVSETTTAAPETTTIPETSETSETAASEEIITEFTRGGLLPEDRTGVPIRSQATL